MIDPAQPLTVLLVCTGNTCRSPMAAAILSHLASERTGEPIKVESAGTLAMDGDSATADAIQAMERRGLDLKEHRARRVGEAEIREATVVLAMTSAHVERLISLAPGAEGQIYTLGAYAGADEEIADPIGNGAEAYERCAAQMESLLPRVLDRIGGTAR